MLEGKKEKRLVAGSVRLQVSAPQRIHWEAIVERM